MTDARPFSILVCFDDTEASGYAFERAARLGARIPGSEIHLVDVVQGDPSEAKTQQLAGQLRVYVNEKAASLGGMKGQRVAVHVRSGDPMREIAQLAAEIEVDLVVVGTPKHPHLLAAALADKLAEHVAAPVLSAGVKPAEPRGRSIAIEPPCPDCLSVRASSRGAQWWCARHTYRGPYGARGHVYSYEREIPLTMHDSEVIPTGIDF